VFSSFETITFNKSAMKGFLILSFLVVLCVVIQAAPEGERECGGDSTERPSKFEMYLEVD
jgi:hypothetical protein